MTAAYRVDDLYDSFCDSLPASRRSAARGLAHTLGLAPSPQIPWSEVFTHRITLHAPALVAEAMPGLAQDLVRTAVAGHMLAVIEAFATDRLEDGQVASSAELVAVLASLRASRDTAIRSLAPLADDPWTDARLVEQVTRGAIAAERRTLRSGHPVSLSEYERLSEHKQWVALPASIALAHAAGWPDRKRKALRRMLLDIGLGLQLHDDVVDWEDDVRRGGAWAEVLAAELLRKLPNDKRPTMPPTAGAVVFQSQALVHMLRRSSWRYRAARLRAGTLGARELTRWAAERERALADLAGHEASHSGFVSRSRALAPWARAFLG